MNSLSTGRPILLHEKFVPEGIKNGLKKLGQGSTSIAFEKSKDKIILVTLEKYKKDWITISNMGKFLKSVKVFLPKFNKKMDIYIFSVKRYYPLSTENKKKLLNFLDEFNFILDQETLKTDMKKEEFKSTSHKEFVINIRSLKRLLETSHVKNILDQKTIANLIKLGEKYLKDNKTYVLDIFNSENWLQDSNGQLVLIDPFILEEYLNLL